MSEQQNKFSFNGNDELKPANAIEQCSEAEYKWRLEEVLKCSRDIYYFAENYFTIIGTDLGEHIIKLFPKQKELLGIFKDYQRVVALAARQTSKTSTYTIYCLWMILFNLNHKILITADTKEHAIEFLDRIKFAYEKLPSWIKPGAEIWNKTSVEFGNGCWIGVTATTKNAGKGKSINCLIVDEAAAVEPGIMKEFWASITPVISSGKTTKVFMISSSNGMGNLFSDIYIKATSDEKSEWKSFRMDWWDFPGRDEAWKKTQLEILGGNQDAQDAFDVQYGNKFVSAKTPTLIPQTTIEYFRKIGFAEDAPKSIPAEIFIGEKKYTLHFWNMPRIDRTYIIGADIGDGVGKDFSVFYVLDITEFRKISIVCSFRSNTISTIDLSYLISKVAELYNKPYIALERNGLGSAVINLLRVQPYFYQYFISYGDNKNHGIVSHVQIKAKACLWMKELFTKFDVDFNIFDNNLIEEFEGFVRKPTIKHTVYDSIGGKNNDCILALLWPLFALDEDNVSTYFHIPEFQRTTTDMKIPRYVQSIINTTPINFSISFDEIYAMTKTDFNIEALIKDFSTAPIDEEHKLEVEPIPEKESTIEDVTDPENKEVGSVIVSDKYNNESIKKQLQQKMAQKLKKDTGMIQEIDLTDGKWQKQQEHCIGFIGASGIDLDDNFW